MQEPLKLRQTEPRFETIPLAEIVFSPRCGLQGRSPADFMVLMESSIVVSKFGGTSMGDASCIRQSARLAVQRNSHVVVVSATSGTTNQLIELAQESEKGTASREQNRALDLVKAICEKHIKIANDLQIQGQVRLKLEDMFQELNSLVQGIQLLKEASPRAMDRIVSLGERMSSVLFVPAWQAAFAEKNVTCKVEWLDAREVIITDEHFGKARPQISLIKNKSMPLLDSILKHNTYFVTQGFIGATPEGITTTLGRGGSDYSAALLAEALDAKTLEIWTDVPGIATTDPRLCPQARPIDEISFTETSELATFGAKVLHPATLLPALRQKIPVFVGSTFNPEKNGTWVKQQVDQKPLVRAIAVRKKQVLLTLTTPEMLQSHGFLYQIFKVFNENKVSIDAITTSEISVAMTVDDSTLLNKKLIAELSQFAEVHMEENLALVALIGNNINHTPGLAEKIFHAIASINVRMICLGASRHNFCVLVNETQANEAVQKLHKEFIETKI